ncbi:MAG: thermonuclease family protein [Chthoniobacteraceae bacterium]
MTHRRRANWIAKAIFAAAIASVFHLPAQADIWKTYEGCRLIENAYFDGDSFHVDAPAGSRRHTYIFRLYGADCPETDRRYPARIAQQAKEFRLPTSEILNWGQRAREFARKFLNRPFTVYTRKLKARGKSDQPRYYAIIIGSDGRDLARSLVEEGLARAFGVFPRWPLNATPYRYRQELKRRQAIAKQKRTGVWARSSQSKLLKPFRVPG